MWDTLGITWPEPQSEFGYFGKFGPEHTTAGKLHLYGIQRLGVRDDRFRSMDGVTQLPESYVMVEFYRSSDVRIFPGHQWVTLG